MRKFLLKLNKWQVYLLIIFILGVLFFPISSQSLSEWKVKVVNKQNKPLANVRVEQSWRDYTYSDGGYESNCTNHEGEVIFPERKLKAGLVYRGFFLFINSLPLIHVTSSGTSANVKVYDNSYTSSPYFWKDKETKKIGDKKLLLTLITVEKSHIYKEGFGSFEK